MKKLKFLAILAIASVVFITGCKKDEYVEKVNVCPLVVSTIPVDKAIDVPLNQVISATFNEKMNPATITQASFSVQQGATVISGTKSATVLTPVAGTITYSGETASFTPSSPLIPNTVYTGRVTTAAKDLIGQSLQADYVWTFTTIAQVTLSSNPVAGGTTSGAGTFAKGSTVIVTATPNAGYVFTNWTENGAIVSTSSPYQFTMNGSRTLVANFSLQFALTISSNPVAGGTTLGAGLYTTGTSVTALALPSTEYTFVNWTDNGTIASTNASFVFVLTANRVLVANFALKTYTLVVTATNGTVVKNPAQATYNSGTTVQLTATPSAGYTFTSWSGDATGTTNPLTVTMNANKAITANFTAIAYTLNVTANNGTVVKNPAQATYASGSTVQLTATPNAGYTFTSWSGDATGSTNPLTVTMSSNKNITANFTQNTFTLNVTALNGTVVKNPAQATYNSGSTVQLTATPNAGYTFTSWSGDATGTTNPLTVTMNANKAITANFTATGTTYTLNVIAVNGTVLKNPFSATYNSGDVVELTATPNSGYAFTSWSGDATGSVNPLSVTMNSNKTITANFTVIPASTFTLNVTTVNGSVLKNPDLVFYPSGTIVQLTATPNPGYTFSSWGGDASGSVNPLSVTMNSDKNITANFTLIPTGVCPTIVDLGTAGDYAILTKAGISTTGVTSVTGNMGVSPITSTAITGNWALNLPAGGTFSTSPFVTGNIYAPDYAAPTPANLTTAISNMETAYTTANGLVVPAPVNEFMAGNLNGQTLTAGIYKWSSNVGVTNGIVLDGGGDNCATFIFQIAGDLTVANGAIITLQNGAQAKNIFWVVAGSKAALGTTVDFSGNILSKTLISLNTGAKITGRLLAQTAVTLNASNVTKP